MPALQQILDGCKHINEVVVALKAFDKRVELGSGPSAHVIDLGEILRRHGRG